MYKTAVYRLVNGGITHQKQQTSEKGDTTQQYMPKCQCTSVQYYFFQIFAVFDV